MALTKKKKIWITVGTVITVIVLALAITIGVLFWPKAYTPTDFEKVLNFQGYNKAADAALVKEWQAKDWKDIDFKNDSALDIVNNAIHNTGLATQKVSFIITESELFGDQGTDLEKLKFLNKSTYLAGIADGMSYSQIISQPQQLKLGSVDGSRLAGNFGYVTRSFNHQKQGGSKGNFQKGTEDDPITVPAGAKATWGKLVENKAAVDFDDVTTVASAESAQRYKMKEVEGSTKVYDPVTKEWVSAIKLSNGEWIPLWGAYTYQIGDEVIDAAASKATVTKNKDGYYTVKLIYKTGPANSKYVALDGKPLFDSVIDQACRYAGGSLASDLLSIGVLKVDTIRYTKLAMTYEIWEDGLLKSMVREETMTANVSALGMYSGHGGTENVAHEVYSYDDRDTVDFISAMYKEAGATK